MPSYSNRFFEENHKATRFVFTQTEINTLPIVREDSTVEAMSIVKNADIKEVNRFSYFFDQCFCALNKKSVTIRFKNSIVEESDTLSVVVKNNRYAVRFFTHEKKELKYVKDGSDLILTQIPTEQKIGHLKGYISLLFRDPFGGNSYIFSGPFVCAIE